MRCVSPEKGLVILANWSTFMGALGETSYCRGFPPLSGKLAAAASRAFGSCRGRRIGAPGCRQSVRAGQQTKAEYISRMTRAEQDYGWTFLTYATICSL